MCAGAVGREGDRLFAETKSVIWFPCNGIELPCVTVFGENKEPFSSNQIFSRLPLCQDGWWRSAMYEQLLSNIQSSVRVN